MRIDHSLLGPHCCSRVDRKQAGSGAPGGYNRSKHQNAGTDRTDPGIDPFDVCKQMIEVTSLYSRKNNASSNSYEGRKYAFTDQRRPKPCERSPQGHAYAKFM